MLCHLIFMIPKRNDRIKKIIKEKRVTQQELAEHIGVRQATINAQINGEREIDSLRTIEAVVALTGCNREWLMYGSGQKEGSAQETLSIYNPEGGHDAAPIFVRLNVAKEEADLLKHILLDNADAQIRLDKILDILKGLASENELLKNKIINIYEKWEGRAAFQENNH